MSFSFPNLFRNVYVCLATIHPEMADIGLDGRMPQGVPQAFSRRFPSETLGWCAVDEICCGFDDFWPHFFWQIGADSNTSSFCHYHPPRTLSGAVLFWCIWS